MNRVNKEIHSILGSIQGVCTKYNVNKMYIFGSALTDRYKRGESDLDILIDIDDIYLKNIVRVKTELSLLTGSKIDLFKVGWVKTEEMLRYLKKNKVLIYDKGVQSLTLCKTEYSLWSYSAYNYPLGAIRWKT